MIAQCTLKIPVHVEIVYRPFLVFQMSSVSCIIRVENLEYFFFLNEKKNIIGYVSYEYYTFRRSVI